DGIRDGHVTGVQTCALPICRVRQALLYAINREAIIDEVFLGRFTPAHGILPPGTLGFNPRLRGYPYDAQRARALLAEAGFPNGQIGRASCRERVEGTGAGEA